MAGLLYVKLDASYADDEKIIVAGEKAEVLYIRGLCLAKRILSDGFIADAHLPRFGLSGVQKRAQSLVDVGLWERDDEAGGYWIVSWLKHNNSAEEVEEIRTKRREAGAKGGKRSRKQSAKQSASQVGNQTNNPEEVGKEETEVEKEKASEPEVSDAARELCRTFVLEHCRPNQHGEPSKGSRAWRTWLVEMDRLVRIGPPNVGEGVDPNRVRDVIRGMADDRGDKSFPGWSAVCESVPAFREKFTKIAAAVDARQRNGHARASPRDVSEFGDGVREFAP